MFAADRVMLQESRPKTDEESLPLITSRKSSVVSQASTMTPLTRAAHECNGRDIFGEEYSGKEKCEAAVGLFGRVVCSPLSILMTCILPCMGYSGSVLNSIWGCGRADESSCIASTFAQPCTVLCPTSCLRSVRAAGDWQEEAMYRFRYDSFPRHSGSYEGEVYS